MKRTAARAAAVSVLLVALAGCSDATMPASDGTGEASDGNRCTIDTSFLVDTGIGRGSIPSLDDPLLVDLAAEPAPDLLEPDTRVVGLTVEGRAYAVPHNLLWYHEIVNLDLGSEKLAVTLCPLTGSSLAFDRAAVDGARLGVTGLLFKSNLVMFSKEGDGRSIWPQMQGEAVCGPAAGTELTPRPSVEMRWSAWRELHPTTVVVMPRGVGEDFPYERNPYSAYVTNEDFGAGMPPLDRRRPVKERVLGVPAADGDPGIAFPYGELEALQGSLAAVPFSYRGQDAVVLWSDDARGAAAFRPRTRGGRSVILRAGGSGLVDAETGSRWTVDGRAVAGPLAGARLEPLAGSYVAYWAPWAAFFPETRLWQG